MDSTAISGSASLAKSLVCNVSACFIAYILATDIASYLLVASCMATIHCI